MSFAPGSCRHDRRRGLRCLTGRRTGQRDRQRPRPIRPACSPLRVTFGPKPPIRTARCSKPFCGRGSCGCIASRRRCGYIVIYGTAKAANGARRWLRASTTPPAAFAPSAALIWRSTARKRRASIPLAKPSGPSGGAVRFGRPDPRRWLVIGEGIETVLSVALALHCPSWAALSTGGLIALQLPREARRVLIAADNDPNGEG